MNNNKVDAPKEAENFEIDESIVVDEGESVNRSSIMNYGGYKTKENVEAIAATREQRLQLIASLSKRVAIGDMKCAQQVLNI